MGALGLLAASTASFASSTLKLTVRPVVPVVSSAGPLLVEVVLHNTSHAAMTTYIHTATNGMPHYDTLALSFRRSGSSTNIPLPLSGARKASAPIYHVLAPGAQLVQRIDLRPWIEMHRVALVPGSYKLTARWQVGQEASPNPPSAHMPWPPWEGTALSPPVVIDIH